MNWIERETEMAGTAWHDAIVEGFRANDIRLICHVADTVLAPIIRRFEEDPDFETVTLTREEEGIGLLTGAYLGGKRGALLLQASGLGNTLNAIGSLAIPYQIPFPILLSPRGEPLEHNLVQLAWGKAAPKAVDALDLQWLDMRREDEVPFLVEHGVHHAYVSRRPLVLSISTQLSGGKRGAQ
ncbi:MAG: decarboxylase [Chloroflexota bacterium]